MSTRRAPFRQIDLQRALRAAKNAGFDVLRYEIEPSGKIVIVTAGGPMGPEILNPLDQWLASRARATQGNELHDEAAG